MKQFFSFDSPLMNFLGKLADLIILNLLFVLCSFPIITVGASATAMCYVTLKARDGYEGNVCRYFFKSFRQNFLQATLIWVILMILMGILWVDYNLVHDAQGVGYQIIRIILPVCAIIWAMVLLYVFFLQARLQNTVPQTIRNALALAVSNAPRCILALAILVAVWRIMTLTEGTFSYGVLVWLVVGFSGLTKINCHILCGKIEGLAPDDKETHK